MKMSPRLLAVISSITLVLAVASFPVTAQSKNFLGVSGYPCLIRDGTYSTTVIDEIIVLMKQEGLNVYRMSFRPSVNPNVYVQHYLTRCSYDLIVDYYHQWPSGEMNSTEWADTTNKALDLLGNFSAYQDRLWLEPCNERTNVDLAERVQDFLNAIRGAGYTSKIVVNQHGQSWSSMATISDPLDKFYTGRHPYFENWSLEGIVGEMQTAKGYGLKLMNTEVGADSNDTEPFDQVEVDRLNAFLEWCYGNDVGNAVWMRYGLENYPKYQKLGLTFPSNATTPTPTPTNTPTPTLIPTPTATPTQSTEPVPTPTLSPSQSPSPTRSSEPTDAGVGLPPEVFYVAAGIGIASIIAIALVALKKKK
jgi:hypothetical protein